LVASAERHPGSRWRHHSALRQREGEKHPDREQRDQRVGLTVEGRVDHRRRDGENDDAGGEREAISHAQEHPGSEAVTRHEVQQARKSVEGGIGRHQQYERGRHLHERV